MLNIVKMLVLTDSMPANIPLKIIYDSVCLLQKKLGMLDNKRPRWS